VTQGVHVREAAVGEAPVLAALHLATALHAYAGIFPPEAPVPVLDDVVAQWRTWLGHDLGDRRATAFVAERAGELVGVVLAAPDPDEPDTGHLSRLYVTPPCWAVGIGRRLHDTVLAHLAGVGFAAATLWVLERNGRARSWYERLGWTATGDQKTVYAPAGIVDVRYRRPLP